MGYFAARSAPFGVVPTAVVTATFYNFAPERVAKALPAAWDVASPTDALRARQESAVAALRRYGVTDDDAVAAAELPKKPHAARRSTVGRCSRRMRRWTGRTNPSPGCGTR